MRATSLFYHISWYTESMAKKPPEKEAPADAEEALADVPSDDVSLVLTRYTAEVLHDVLVSTSPPSSEGKIVVGSVQGELRRLLTSG